MSQYPSGPIAIFDPAHLTGAPAPTRTVSGGIYGIGIDSHDNLYVLETGAHTIHVYVARILTLIRTISGPNTLLNNPGTLALDASGRLYVTNANQVTVYSPGANGNVAPIAVVGGANTNIQDQGAPVVAPNGSLYLSTTLQNAVLIFAPLFTP